MSASTEEKDKKLLSTYLSRNEDGTLNVGASLAAITIVLDAMARYEAAVKEALYDILGKSTRPIPLYYLISMVGGHSALSKFTYDPTLPDLSDVIRHIGKHSGEFNMVKGVGGGFSKKR